MGCGGSAQKPPPKDDKAAEAAGKPTPAPGETKASEPTKTGAVGTSEQRTGTGEPADAFSPRTEVNTLAKIEIVSGKDLPAMDGALGGGKSDPFVVVTFGRHVFRTSTCKKEVNPRWEQLVVFFVTMLERKFEVQFDVYDEDKIDSNDYIASAQVKAEILMGDGGNVKKDLQLPLKNKKGDACGTLIIRTECFDKGALEKLYWEYIFAMFDKDGSKTLEKSELIMLLEVIGHGALAKDQEKLGTLYEKADKDRSGALDPNEFYKFATDLYGGNTLPTEYGKGEELKDIINLAEQLMAQKLAEGDGYDCGLQGGQKDLVWYIGLILLGLAPGQFYNSKNVPAPSTIKLILSESHSMTPEGAAGVSSDAGQTDNDEGTNLGATIFYQNRTTGRVEVEKVDAKAKTGMRIVYGNPLIKPEAACGMLRKLTEAQGKEMEDPASVKNIPGFIEYHGLNMSECLDPISSYKTFNEFFYRKLKPGERPQLAKGPGVLLCPADARTNVFNDFNTSKEMWVKGVGYSVEKLLGGGDDAARMIGFLGSNPCVVISRLAPQDYHRFHTACSGKLLSKKMVGGELYTVNPIAIRSAVDVFCENVRCVMEIDTGEENFGKMVHIAVGATCVGSITVIKEIGDEMGMNDDFGYFAFGGSTCITLYPEGSVVFADDLQMNSAKPIETLTRVGQILGAKTREKLDEIQKEALTSPSAAPS